LFQASFKVLGLDEEIDIGRWAEADVVVEAVDKDRAFEGHEGDIGFGESGENGLEVGLETADTAMVVIVL
jgi:hypothetical protein